ncbi:sensor histidine kinase [Synechococcus sp. W2B2]|uniref:sensor histidine kinase n=1 Tax=unclassified Synechococcus TaxID=2626047 RepID=UPI000320D075|nr:HAMP domain-containing sensor histidine kinase [Synechococcus sp. WH 7805]
MKRSVLPSLRGWLQSTAVLSVIAGYVILLGVNAALGDLQRRQQHLKLAASLRQEASAGVLAAGPLRSLGLEVRVLSEGEELRPSLRKGPSGQQWLVSRSTLELANGERRFFELRQDVSLDLEQQHLAQLLLVAAAGVSILFTSLLLRPVLRRGLVVPLNDLDQELQALEADTLGDHLLDPMLQPQELRSIAHAFNNLQQRLAEAWKRERSFVDGVAHELRTPITVISGHSQRLKRQVLPDLALKSVESIDAEARRMGSLLTALRELARCDAGRLQLQLQHLDADEQLLLAHEQAWPRPADRFPLPLPSTNRLPLFSADPSRVQQCLQLLITNALNFSTGSVRLFAEVTDQQLVLHVQDSGPGIAESERALVLQRFQRGSSAAGQRGPGVGLALVDELMRAMNAAVVIADAPGGGADLQLRFKLAPDAP